MRQPPSWLWPAAILVVGAVILIECVGCSPIEQAERGAPPKPIPDGATYAVTFVPDATLARLRVGTRRVGAMHVRNGDHCVMILPKPGDVSFEALGRRLAHEARHCNGEQHNFAGVWMP
jgi:hypothetical protein